MELHLNNKVYIVTGGAKGIGEAISLGLAAEQAHVVIAGRSESDNERTVQKIRQLGFQAYGIKAELTKESDCQKVIDETVKTYGQIDGIINNAGVNDGISLETGTVAAFVESLQKNLVHYYSLVHHALPYLKKQTGCIVNIGSKVAETGQGRTSGYAASKGAINALTREWAVELLPYGIRVNAVIPAEVWTPLYEHWINSLPDPEKAVERIVSRIPLGKRFTTSEEIANAVLFLVSSRSSHTTGQILYVDGGYTHLDRAIS